MGEPIKPAWVCPECHEEHEASFQSCWRCGTTPEGTPPPDPSTFSLAGSLSRDEAHDRIVAAGYEPPYFILPCTFLGGHGWHCLPNDPVTVAVNPDHVLAVGSAGAMTSLEVSSVSAVTVGGPGSVTTDAGIGAIGFGLGNFLKAAITAEALNWVTRRTTTTTLLAIDAGPNVRGVFLNETMEPFELELRISRLLSTLEYRTQRPSGSGSVVADLEALVELHQAGWLDVSEFRAAKAHLLHPEAEHQDDL